MSTQRSDSGLGDAAAPGDPFELFAWEPEERQAGPVGPAPWGLPGIPAALSGGAGRQRVVAPADLRGWTPPNGAIVLLGERHRGPFHVGAARDVDFVPGGDGMPLIESAGETDRFGVWGEGARNVRFHGIAMRGGRGAFRLDDCQGCGLYGCDVSGAHVHGIWLAGGDCHHNEIAYTDSHDNGREKAYEKKPGDWRSLGHGVIPTDGAHHNLVHHYRGYRNWEDGIQLSPDCGPANRFELCMLWWNHEDGVDTKCNQGNVFRHVHSRRNRHGGFNHHCHAADDSDPLVMWWCSSYDENSPFEVEAAARVRSTGGRYWSAKNSCLKVSSGVDVPIVSTDEAFANGWRAAARIYDGRGSRFTRVTFRSDDDDPACLVSRDARAVSFQDCKFVGSTGLVVKPPATATVT